MESQESHLLSPRERAQVDYDQCFKAGKEAYNRALEPTKAYNNEILDIQRSLRKCMETAEAALAPLIEVVRAAEFQAEIAYKKAFEEEREKIKGRWQ